MRTAARRAGLAAERVKACMLGIVCDVRVGVGEKEKGDDGIRRYIFKAIGVGSGVQVPNPWSGLC